MVELAEKMDKLDKLAREVLTLSRNTLMVNLRFLDMALSMFNYVPSLETTLATDGQHILYHPAYLLSGYQARRELPVRAYLHMVFHCVFRHYFITTVIDQPCWDLACDIAVENAITELRLKSVEVPQQIDQLQIIVGLKAQVKHLTAEKLYHYYRQQNLQPSELTRLRQPFLMDDHTLWYLPPDISGGSCGDGIDNQNGITAMSRMELQERWLCISQRMQTDLETFSKQRGDKAGSLMQSLVAVNREKYDYTAFLKKFAVLGEVMKINDDEFDYIFYTYGLKLYGKIPLIEPLEYKEVNRVREFVIAIDTSGSVSGELVQKFVQKTYNILKSAETFFSKINLHIIQCDAEIQQDMKITSQEEFDAYLKSMQLHGFGGTDFRPVFSYVDELRRKHEFPNLKGLIYFTDGYGVFPDRMPDYHTAFVFIKDDYEIPEIPVWAIKLVLQSGEI